MRALGKREKLHQIDTVYLILKVLLELLLSLGEYLVGAGGSSILGDTLFDLSHKLVVLVIKFRILLYSLTIFRQIVKIIFIFAEVLNIRLVHIIVDLELDLSTSQL